MCLFEVESSAKSEREMYETPRLYYAPFINPTLTRTTLVEVTREDRKRYR